MDNKANKGFPTDFLGLAPYGEALKLTIEKGFEGASALLSRMCLPAAEELGLMLKDRVRYWRLKNIINIVNRVPGKIGVDNNTLQLTVHPRIMNEVMENGSWCDDESLQDMWAGLLASSWNANGDDANILFTQKLKNITTIQAKVVKIICEQCNVTLHDSGLIEGRNVQLTLDQLINITGCDDVNQLDSELDSLRANELISSGVFERGGGFNALDNPLVANLRPSAILLHLHAKTQGFSGQLKTFYQSKLIPFDRNDPEHTVIIDSSF
jgi:hypothetical protein